MKQNYTWPAIQAAASMMSVIGGVVGLYIDPENRKNPFFYTAILNPALYASANLYQVYKIYKHNQNLIKEEQNPKIEIQKQTFVESLKERSSSGNTEINIHIVR